MGVDNSAFLNRVIGIAIFGFWLRCGLSFSLYSVPRVQDQSWLAVAAFPFPSQLIILVRVDCS